MTGKRRLKDVRGIEMRRTFWFLGVAGVVVAGCALAPDREIGGPATFLLCGGVDPATELTELPGDLQHVINRREVFAVNDHPLKDVTIGTAIEDIRESLNGCWGYIGTEKVSALYHSEVSVAAVYKIDLDRRRMLMVGPCQGPRARVHVPYVSLPLRRRTSGGHRSPRVHLHRRAASPGLPRFLVVRANVPSTES